MEWLFVFTVSHRVRDNPRIYFNDARSTLGGIIAVGVVAGCLFRGLYFLYNMHRRISGITPKPDRAKEEYQNYIKERENALPKEIQIKL